MEIADTETTNTQIGGINTQIGGMRGQQPDPVTPVVVFRKSTRIGRALPRYSSSANYLLLTENDEPQCDSEEVQLEDSVQWE